MRYVAGLDGGGTKTAVTVAAENGMAVQSFEFGGINYNGQDEESIRSNFREIFAAIADVCGGLERCMQICIAAAGVSNPDVGARLEANARACGYQGNLIITGDHDAALWGAQDNYYGMILIAGTGSICYGRDAHGQSHRAGGFGYLIDDEGSGYSIGRELLTAVLRAYDGRSSHTVITDMVYKQLQVGSAEEIVGFVYHKSRSKKDIAALAPILSEACALGDEAALDIARKSAAALFELVVPVAERLSLQEGTLAMAGSVLLKNTYVQTAFMEQLKQAYPGMNCIAAKKDAASGAVLIALSQLK